MLDTTHSGSAPAATPSRRRDALLLALAFGLLYFFRLGSYPLSNPDEGRNAEVPREMLASGDFVTPRLDGVNYFEKPPLVYWATAAAEKLFGLNEWAVRAVPALLAVWGVLIVYRAGRELSGRLAGLLAAVVLGTSLLWFGLGHVPILDMAVSVLMSRALLAFLLAVREPVGPRRRRLFYELYASMALATLAKGLMGFLVSGAVMFLWLCLFGQWRRLRPLYLPTGALLFLALAAPWHILAALHNETWVHRYFVEEHFLRFFTGYASRPGPWHLYIWIIVGGLIPWTGFLWPAVRDAVRGGWARRQDRAEAWYFVTWAGFIFLFFSVSHSKLIPYILPVFPALALLIGAWLARMMQAEETAAMHLGRRPPLAASLRLGFRLFTVTCGVLAGALCMVLLRPALVRMDLGQAQALRVPGFAMAGVLLLGGVVAAWLARVRSLRAACAGIVATMGLFFGLLISAMPDIQKTGTRELALYVKAHAQPADRVFHYNDFYQDFTFYAERLVGVVGSNVSELELKEDAAARASGRFITDTEFLRQWAGAGRIYLVVRKRKIDELKADYARNLADWQKAPPPGATAPERPVFADPAFQYHLLAENREYCLLSNQP
jgi:4-amino-4-deoxy-L-arabinose transferase-like glycosyltransferase